VTYCTCIYGKQHTLNKRTVSIDLTDVQYIADDADAPHVRREVDGVVACDFRRHELRRAEHHPRLDGRVVVAGQTEVDDLDPVTGTTETEDVLRLRNSNVHPPTHPSIGKVHAP